MIYFDILLVVRMSHNATVYTHIFLNDFYRKLLHIRFFYFLHLFVVITRKHSFKRLFTNKYCSSSRLCCAECIFLCEGGYMLKISDSTVLTSAAATVRDLILHHSCLFLYPEHYYVIHGHTEQDLTV